MNTTTISSELPLIFMHIPKTAGMSLVAAFSDCWPDRVIDLYDMTEGDSPNTKHKLQDRQAVAYCGHFPHGLHQWLDRPSLYLSIVREPLERILSFYNFVSVYRKRCLNYLLTADRAAEQSLRRGRQLPNVSRLLRQVATAAPKMGGMTYEDAMIWQNATLLERFRIMGVPSYLDDFSPWIAGDDNLETFLACPSQELDNAMTRRFSGIGLQQASCTRQTFEQAKQNIENDYSIVGVKEHYETTIGLIREVFGLPWLLTQPKNVSNHVNTNPVQASADILAHLAERNQWDLALYDWITERFQTMIGTPPKELLRVVPGGARTDYEQIRCWTGVGRMDAIRSTS